MGNRIETTAERLSESSGEVPAKRILVIFERLLKAATALTVLALSTYVSLSKENQDQIPTWLFCLSIGVMSAYFITVGVLVLGYKIKYRPNEADKTFYGILFYILLMGALPLIGAGFNALFPDSTGAKWTTFATGAIFVIFQTANLVPGLRLRRPSDPTEPIGWPWR